jgi:hypothetical protein
LRISSGGRFEGEARRERAKELIFPLSEASAFESFEACNG